jgi:hypothetical protein
MQISNEQKRFFGKALAVNFFYRNFHVQQVIRAIKNELFSLSIQLKFHLKLII